MEAHLQKDKGLTNVDLCNMGKYPQNKKMNLNIHTYVSKN